MMNSKAIEWVLRIAVAGEFIGHAMFAVGPFTAPLALFSSPGKAEWAGWIAKLTGVDPVLAAQLLFLVGLVDILVAIIVLTRPIRIVLLWAVFWGFWTALVRPLVGASFWDFIERFANWGAPLALLLLLGWPKTVREWFSK